MRRAIASIDGMKRMLVSADAGPGDYQIADSVFHESGKGAALYQEIDAAYAAAFACCADPASVSAVQGFWYNDEANARVEEWRIRNFFHVPRVAVVAILSKTQGELGRAQQLAQDDLFRQCAAKH